jgi:hypothetical protein
MAATWLTARPSSKALARFLETPIPASQIKQVADEGPNEKIAGIQFLRRMNTATIPFV